MKTRFNRIKMPVVLAAGLVSACSWSAAAADMGSNFATDANATSTDADTTGFYERGDAGVSILQDMTSEGLSIQYNVGPKVDLSAGYNITPNIAVELQGGFAYNTVSSFNDISLPPGYSADVWTVPLMVNGIYKIALDDHWRAYGGGGIGAVISTLGIRSGGYDFDNTDCEFGYQIMLGINYSFNDNLECGLGYNFVGSLGNDWSVFGPGFTTSPTYLHSILLSLTYKF